MDAFTTEQGRFTTLTVISNILHINTYVIQRIGGNWNAANEYQRKYKNSNCNPDLG